MTDFDTWCRTHEDRHERMDTLIERMQGDIKELRDDLTRRLPLWATILLSVLTAAVGWLVK